MKQKIKLTAILFLFILLLILISNNSVLAAEVSTNEIENEYDGENVYIIGKHMFTKGYISTKEIMLASTTIEGNNLDLNDMVIYRKTPTGEWKDATVNENVTLPNNFEIQYEELEEFVATQDIKNKMKEQANALKSTYYNKTGDQVLRSVDESIYYINLGEYTATETPTKLTIEGNEYVTGAQPISIGNNRWIYVPVWKIDGSGNLLVALPWLAIDSLPVGSTTITLKGDDGTVYQTYKVVTYEDVSSKELSIASAAGIYQKDNYTNIATVTEGTVEYKSGYGTQALGLIIKDDEGNTITGTSEIIFRRDNNGNMGLTEPEIYNGTAYTYTLYCFDYKDSGFANEETTNLNYKLAIPGKGVINVAINAKGIVETQDIKNKMQEQANALKSTYYNKTGDQVLRSVDESIYYINLGKYTATETPTKLTIEGNEYGAEAQPISIGNNRWIYVPVWKIDGSGNLLVALPWLAIDSLPVGSTTITLKGNDGTVYQTYKVVTYEDVSSKELSIASVAGIYQKDNYTNTATVTAGTVEYKSGYGTQALGLVIKDDEGNTITGTSEIIFRRDNNGVMGLTEPEIYNGIAYTYTLYCFDYKDSGFTNEETANLNYKLAIPGKGVINIVISAKGIVE